MHGTNSLKLLSEKLISSINFIPEKVEILSELWYDVYDELVQCNFKLDSSVDHKFYLKEDSDKKIYVFWDYNSIDQNLKGFFTTLVRVLKFSGTKDILVLDECFSLSDMEDDIVGISDHINFSSDNPLIGKNIDEMGTRFPDMSHAYSGNYPAGFVSVKKVILAGVEDLNLSDKKLSLIKLSEAEVYNFSVFWMNILAVHSSISFSAVCRVK